MRSLLMARKPGSLMMTRNLRLCMVLLFPLLALAGPQVVCTEDDAMQAESVAAQASTWEALYRQFVSYGHCDDGTIAEGFSSTVSQLFANNWASIATFSVLAKRDPAFKRFVFKHIDETASWDELRVIKRHSSQECPQRLKQLCVEIHSTPVLARF